MEFIPVYANYGGDNYGEEVNPDFRERTFLQKPTKRSDSRLYSLFGRKRGASP